MAMGRCFGVTEVIIKEHGSKGYSTAKECFMCLDRDSKKANSKIM